MKKNISSSHTPTFHFLIVFAKTCNHPVVTVPVVDLRNTYKMDISGLATLG